MRGRLRTLEFRKDHGSSATGAFGVSACRPIGEEGQVGPNNELQFYRDHRFTALTAPHHASQCPLWSASTILTALRQNPVSAGGGRSR